MLSALRSACKYHEDTLASNTQRLGLQALTFTVGVQDSLQQENRAVLFHLHMQIMQHQRPAWSCCCTSNASRSPMTSAVAPPSLVQNFSKSSRYACQGITR